MGYSYVYIGVGIAIVAVGFFLIFYLQPNQQILKVSEIPSGKNNLTKCADNGTTPFMEGFYLQGAEPYTLKTWNWGDGTPQENNTNVVMNHDYRLNKNETSRQFNGNVIEWDYDNPTKGIDIEHFTVTVVNNTNIIGNYDQFEGVIVLDDYAGFSVSYPIPDASYTWYWNKTNPYDSDPASLENSNPSHKYSDIGKYHGNVTITSSSQGAVKDFCVMVLSNMKNITGDIEVNDSSFYISSSVGLAKDNLDFTAQLGPAIEQQITSNQEQLWSFGDNTSLSYISNPPHIYEKGGVYKVKVNVTDSRGYLTLLKTVVILQPTIKIFPTAGPVGTIITVKGSQYPDGNYLVKLGRSMLEVINPSFPVTVKNGTFSVSFLVPNGTLSGPKIIYVEYPPAEKILANTTFNVTRP